VHARAYITNLSPRWGLSVFRFLPTTHVVGCILPPLRGYLS
jgi:hypothetical protein